MARLRRWKLADLPSDLGLLPSVAKRITPPAPGVPCDPESPIPPLACLWASALVRCIL